MYFENKSTFFNISNETREIRCHRSVANMQSIISMQACYANKCLLPKRNVYHDFIICS